MLSHAIACIYFALYYSIPGRPFHYDDDNLLRVIGYAVTTPAMVVMAGIAKRRADRMSEQSLQSEREHSASLRALLAEQQQGRGRSCTWPRRRPRRPTAPRASSWPTSATRSARR